MPLEELVSAVGYPAVVRPVLFYLLFHRLLEIDMRAQLTNKSVVELPKEAFSSQSKMWQITMNKLLMIGNCKFEGLLHEKV